MEKKIVKRYTLFKIIQNNVNNTEVKGEIYLGRIGGYSDSLSYPQVTYDTEEEAINAIMKNNLYGEWAVVPVYSYEYEN